MTIKGQNAKSIFKKSLPNSRTPVVGIKNYKIHHQATGGESYINLTSLTVPSGMVNPSPSEISRMRLKDFSNNWTLTSSIRPLWMEGLAYEIVSNNNIRLLAGFEAQANEIFTIQYHDHVVNGTVIADVRTPGGSGVLAEGSIDFNLGEAIPINDLNNQWPIQFYRGVNGTPVLRNTGNAPFIGDHSIGNYQMIDNGSGYCQVIRFNIAGDVGGEPVFWSARGALGERPNLSVLQRVDKIHGIMDKMRSDLLTEFGFDVTDPTRYDEGVPTQPDLKSFGDLVYNILNTQVPIRTLPASFTPALSGAATAFEISGFKWREGKFLRMKIYARLNALTGDAIGIILPDSLNLDTSKVTSQKTTLGTGSLQKVAGGTVSFANFSGGIMHGFFQTSAGTDRVLLTDLTSGDGNVWFNARAYSGLFASGDGFSFDLTVPISGWNDTQTIKQQLGL